MEYEETQDADAAIGAHNTERFLLHDVELFIRYGALAKLKEPSKTLFVGNLSYDVTEQEVFDLLQPYADLKTVRLSKE